MKANKNSHRLLFIGEGVTLAHVTRPLVLANALDHQRFEIIFGCGHKYKTLIESSGYEVHFVPTILPDVFLERLAKGRPLYTYETLRGYVDAEIKLLSSISPDLIIGDFRLSLGIATDILKIPYVALSNAHWSPYSTQTFPIPEHSLIKVFGIKSVKRILPSLLPAIFWYHARSFNKLRKSFGLHPIGDLRHMYTYGTWTLYTDIPSIAPTHNLPGSHKYIGPIIWSPDIELPNWWGELPEDVPLIYITMGSSGDIYLLRSILETLQNTPFIGVVATAGRIKIKVSSNIYVEDYLPGLQAIKKASMVICNGGSATAYQALSIGVPVLGFPSNVDQFFTMESIQKKGAGILIRPMEAFSDHIQQAINHILHDRTFRESAKKLALEISRYGSTKHFSDFIDAWAEKTL